MKSKHMKSEQGNEQQRLSRFFPILLLTLSLLLSVLTACSTKEEVATAHQDLGIMEVTAECRYAEDQVYNFSLTFHLDPEKSPLLTSEKIQEFEETMKKDMEGEKNLKFHSQNIDKGKDITIEASFKTKEDLAALSSLVDYSEDAVDGDKLSFTALKKEMEQKGWVFDEPGQ